MAQVNDGEITPSLLNAGGESCKSPGGCLLAIRFSSATTALLDHRNELKRKWDF